MNHNEFFLMIETATEICSVAISCGEKIIDKKESLPGQSHAQNLIPLIDTILKDNFIKKEQLKAVGLSSGPGSYTGLRIGASTAKGLCFTLNIPLIAIPTLQNIMLGAINDDQDEHLLFCPMLDARRMEVFCALFNNHGVMVKETEAVIVDKNTFSDLLQHHQIVFCGNGMPKCKDLIAHNSNALFCEMPLSAANMASIVYQKYNEQHFEDVAHFEPFYLKEYLAKKSVVKGL